MDFRLVVAGCRDFNDYSLLAQALDKYITSLIDNKNIIIISGCAEGADKLGELYASENNLKVEKFPAEWEKYGKYAGPRRNEQMAKVADAVIVFWDGKSRGTQSMIKYAKRYHKSCQVVYINE